MKRFLSVLFISLFFTGCYSLQYEKGIPKNADISKLSYLIIDHPGVLSLVSIDGIDHSLIWNQNREYLNPGERTIGFSYHAQSGNRLLTAHVEVKHYFEPGKTYHAIEKINGNRFTVEIIP